MKNLKKLEVLLRKTVANNPNIFATIQPSKMSSATVSTADSDPLFLSITLHANGTLDWNVYSDDAPRTGLYYLSYDIDTVEKPQIVSPGTLGITEQQLREWMAAESAFMRYSLNGRKTSGDRHEYNDRCDSLERTAQALEKDITDAIRRQWDQLEKVVREFVAREDGDEEEF